MSNNILEDYKNPNRPKITVDELIGIAVAERLMNKEELDWNQLIIDHNMDDEFIWTYRKKINKSRLFYYQSPSNDLIDKLIQEFGIYDSERDDPFGYDEDPIDIQLVAMTAQLEDWLIDKYEDRWDWKYIWMYQDLSEERIEKYIQHADWKAISEYQELSIPFIKKYKNKVDWLYIYMRQNLNEDFIEEMGHQTYWDVITAYQTYLSEEFLEKHSGEGNFNWKNVKRYQKNVSQEFLEKHYVDIIQAKSLKDGYKKQRSV